MFGADFDDARENAERLADEAGYRYVHSGNEPHLIAGVGTETLGWIEVFAAFAFARLLETIPLTPSGVGFVETGAVAALIV